MAYECSLSQPSGLCCSLSGCIATLRCPARKITTFCRVVYCSLRNLKPCTRSRKISSSVSLTADLEALSPSTEAVSALIRWHSEGFSSLASWLVLKVALVAPLSCACPDTFQTVKPLENPSRCIPQWCALVLYTMSLWLCTRLHTNRMQQTPPRKLILSRSKTEYVPCSSIYMIMQPMPYMALSTLFLIWYQSALRSANW